jgi:formamidopyrimidine-DNA glycosylase
MPELPEVETTRKGIAPYVEGKKVASVTVRQKSLRWPVPASLAKELPGQKIRQLRRRAKYLLATTDRGTLLIHLGMSGSLRVVTDGEAPRKHDHVDIVMEGGDVLRFHDPRRFGCVMWLKEPVEAHPLLANLGPEPLSDAFNAAYLHATSRKRKAAVKTFIMDGRVVVGVGNIYANEALFAAGINPTRAAGSISLARYEKLVQEIKAVLARAIKVGGTTLRDFVGGDGKPGYFSQSLNVYGRGGEPCKRCGTVLTEIRLGQRSTVYCRQCQK